MDSNILVDQSHTNPSKVPMAANHLDDPGTGGFMTMMRSRHISLNSHSSLNQLLSSTNYHSHHGFSSSPVQPLPPQQMIYASLPSFTLPSLPLVQPPLLPLPSAKATAPKTPSRSANTGSGRMMKPKAAPASTPRKATSNYSRSREQKEQPRKAVESSRSNEEAEKEEGEGEILNMESIYSLSPPPSNLPLPRFLLTRHKITSSVGRVS